MLDEIWAFIFNKGFFMKIILTSILIFLLASVAIGSDWILPMPSAGVEVGSEYLGLPITMGISKTKDMGLVGSGSYFITRVDSSKLCELYVNFVGTAWMEPNFGGTLGVSISPMKQIFESYKSSVWDGSKFYVSPFIAISITNREKWLPTFGVKLVVVNK